MDNNSVLESRGTPRPSESVSFDRAVKALGPVCASAILLALGRAAALSLYCCVCIKVYNYTKSLNIFISGRSNFAFHCLHLTFFIPSPTMDSLPHCPTSPSSSIIIHHQPPTYHFQVPNQP